MSQQIPKVGVALGSSPHRSTLTAFSSTLVSWSSAEVRRAAMRRLHWPEKASMWLSSTCPSFLGKSSFVFSFCTWCRFYPSCIIYFGANTSIFLLVFINPCLFTFSAPHVSHPDIRRTDIISASRSFPPYATTCGSSAQKKKWLPMASHRRSVFLFVSRATSFALTPHQPASPALQSNSINICAKAVSITGSKHLSQADKTLQTPTSSPSARPTTPGMSSVPNSTSCSCRTPNRVAQRFLPKPGSILYSLPHERLPRRVIHRSSVVRREVLADPAAGRIQAKKTEALNLAIWAGL